MLVPPDWIRDDYEKTADFLKQNDKLILTFVIKLPLFIKLNMLLSGNDTQQVLNKDATNNIRT